MSPSQGEDLLGVGIREARRANRLAGKSASVHETFQTINYPEAVARSSNSASGTVVQEAPKELAEIRPAAMIADTFPRDTVDVLGG